MPFLHVHSGDGVSDVPEVTWQVDWTRPLGFERQLTSLKRLLALSYNGTGVVGYLLQSREQTLDLHLTPVELDLQRDGHISMVLDPDASMQPQFLDTFRFGTAEDAAACSYAEHAKWHRLANTLLCDTTGRIPNWRDSIRSGLKHPKPRTRPPPLSVAAAVSVTPTAAAPKILEKLEAPSATAGTNDGYLNPTQPAGSSEPILLDHVPGFLKGDEVEAVAVPSQPTLHGVRGTVVGCEYRGAVMYVVAEFPEHGVAVVQAAHLQNISEMEREAASPSPTGKLSYPVEKKTPQEGPQNSEI